MGQRRARGLSRGFGGLSLDGVWVLGVWGLGLDGFFWFKGLGSRFWGSVLGRGARGSGSYLSRADHRMPALKR